MTEDYVSSRISAMEVAPVLVLTKSEVWFWLRGASPGWVKMLHAGKVVWSSRLGKSKVERSSIMY